MTQQGYPYYGGNPQQQQQQQYNHQYQQQPQQNFNTQPPSVNIPTQGMPTNVQGQSTGQLPMEQSFIENILRLNRGKLASIYTTFENNSQWNAKVFKGIIEAAGRDHVIISDPETGERYLIPMIYLDYVVFPEEIEYYYPAQLTQYNPR